MKKLKSTPKTATKAKTKTAKPAAAKKTPAPDFKKGTVVSITELYEMKKAKEKAQAEAAEAWKHKKNVPPQEQGPVDSGNVAVGGMKKSGFGGSRHS